MNPLYFAEKIKVEDGKGGELEKIMNFSVLPDTILSENTFAEMKDKISEATMKAVTEMGFNRMTEIQAKTIPYLLDGK